MRTTQVRLTERGGFFFLVSVEGRKLVGKLPSAEQAVSWAVANGWRVV